MITFSEIKKTLEKESILDKNGSPAFIIPSKRNIKLILTLENRVFFKEGLKLWLNSTVKKKIISRVLLFFYDIRIIHLFYNNKTSINYKNKRVKNLIPNDNIKTFNIYVGSSKKNNLSITFQLISKKIYYSRLPRNKVSNLFALNEFQNTQYLNSRQCNNISLNTPISCQPSFHQFFYSYESVPGKPIKYNLNSKIFDILKELQFDNYVSFDVLVVKSEIVETHKILNEVDFLSKPNIKKIFNKTISVLSKLEFKESFYHGDFVYWNILEDSGTYSLFDFEYSKKKYLPLLDLCHYVYFGKDFYLKEMTKNQMDYFLKHTYAFLINEKSVIIKGYKIKSILLNIIIFYFFNLLKRFILIEGHLHEEPRIRNTLKNIYLAESLLYDVKSA